jgi:hypothetical protein
MKIGPHPVASVGEGRYVGVCYRLLLGYILHFYQAHPQVCNATATYGPTVA